MYNVCMLTTLYTDCVFAIIESISAQVLEIHVLQTLALEIPPPTQGLKLTISYRRNRVT